MSAECCTKKSCCTEGIQIAIHESANTQTTKTFSQKLSEFAERLLPYVELICRIALAIFAAILNLKLFVITASIGFALGVAYTVYKNIVKEPLEVGLARPSCAQGFFDYLSGIRCPPLISTIITAVFIGGHMHHSPFYIAFCGVPFGAWLGSQATQVAWNLGHRMVYKMPLESVSDIFSPLPSLQKVPQVIAY
jgi:hypothetical protein